MANGGTGAQGWGENSPPPLTFSDESHLPAWASMLGATHSQVKRNCRALANALSAHISRPMTQDEVDGLMQFSAIDVAADALRAPITYGLVAVMFWRGRPMRLPFWKPDPSKYNVNVFPSIANPRLTGAFARYLWVTGRVLAYAMLIGPPAAIVTKSYIAAEFNNALKSDVRLKGLREALTERARRPVLKEWTNVQVRQLERLAAKASKEELIQERDSLQSHAAEALAKIADGQGEWETVSRRDRESAYRTLKDTSEKQIRILEKALAIKDDPESASRQQSDYQGLSGSVEPMPSQTTPAGTTNTLGLPSNKPQPASWSAEQSSGQRWGTSDGIDDDDASPVASGARGKGMDGGSGPSAWDRVRQQAQQGQGQSQQRQQAAPSAESWGSAGSDDADTRTQAQKEFDEMVERERRT